MSRSHKVVTNPADHRHWFSPSIASLLGHVTIHWSALEFELQALIWDLSETEEVGNILTRRLGVERWIEDIQLLARYRIKDDVAIRTLLDALAKIRGVQAQRNALVHGLFVAVPLRRGVVAQLEKKPTGKKLKRQYVGKIRHIKVQELDELISSIHSARQCLVTWSAKYVRAIGQKGRLLSPLRH